MTEGRANIAAGLTGLIWSAALIGVAVLYVQIPVFALIPTIMGSFLAPGLVIALMIARVTLGQYRAGRAADEDLGRALSKIDRDVLNDTLAQAVLALCIWPACAVMLGGYGPGVILCFGIGFALARLLYWVGCHRSHLIRKIGFATSFAPTLIVVIWALGQMGFGYF